VRACATGMRRAFDWEVIDVRFKGLLFSVVAGCFCGGVLCVPQGQPNPTPPPDRDGELVYTQTGGFAGVEHEARFTPDGQIFVSDSMFGDKEGVLSEARSLQLNAALADWDTLPSITAENICCDGFAYSITYHGRTLSWSDFQSGVPARLIEIAGVIASIEQGP
jgi:hypothetical protein